MDASDRQQRLAALRDTIANIERKPALANAAVRHTVGAGQFPVLGPGMVQEIFTDEHRNCGASLGFALGLGQQLLGGPRQVLVYLQLAGESQELGVPYGAGLLSFGLDPAQLILVRPKDMVELLWAAEEALACRGVAAVVAEIGGQPKILDFTASRRLSLRAQASKTSIFLLRYGTGREASAAQFRWHIGGARSGEMPYDPRAPGETRWRVVREKGALAQREQQEWILGWSENGFYIVDTAADHAPERRTGTTLPSAPSPQLGDRLRQTA
ncbi:ImuA family protein [Devosia sp. RR2S18]|uniref:ImuA family protein n=1 Tax=Devosia rhizosphaerae TaxID=3049774 RepID=UPI0025425154|nr:hypothetical protein [Devosia sp. RR2S18]WIJ25524.1 hypothetical protein QOV41_01765 [Devosia sp. RR2S18]